ncbi:MAG TPA: c-type cytochrome, partial [Chitinophagaceae bacterium]|nr:c-type cytochrome [Chitinophagaceae bacterium]
NIRTGRLAWVFRTIPHPGEPGYDTWPEDAYKNFDVGGANCWGGMAIDRQRGIVYVPTGSAAYDYYGAKRKGANLFANCLLALNASTGALLWYQQLVHHDIWDRDLPAPPNLVTITRNGQRIDAVAQITKQGFVFVFDRESGKPLYPVVEKNVPASVTPGEHSWPTQPMPLRPLPYMRQTLTEQDISPFAENKDELLATFRNARYKGSFTPLFGQSIVFPGLDGGAEWGGAAVDPEGVIYINSNEVPWLLNLKKRAVETPNSTLSAGNNIYNAQCASCHGKERKGSVASGFPSLLNLQGKRSREYLHNIIANGKGMMPAFTSLSKEQKETLVAFLLNQEKPTASRGLAKEPGLQTEAQRRQSAYYLSSVAKFLDSKGLPAITPPWGTLNAIDLNTGDYVWRIPFGEYPELVAKGIDNTGAESYGGPVVTASGLLFIAGTKDKKFRVYDKNSGKLLWQTILPAASFATPATYQVNGKQYIVLACGGSKLGAAPGDSYVAFALP